MTATDELRRLLDERGVEYDLLDESIAHLTMWQTCYEGLRHECQFDECHGESKLEIWDCTPGQAIAATLGRGTCKLEETESYSSDRVIVHVLECSNCGQECEHVNGDYEYCPHCLAKNELF